MSVTAVRESSARLPRWAIVLFGLGMVALLVAPAIVVLLLREPAVIADGQRLRAGHQPTDVAVEGSTVWVVSGRDDRVVALDGRDASQDAVAHAAGSSPLRLAVGAGSVWTANAADDSVTRLDPLIPGSGRRIGIGTTAVDVA